MSGIGNNTTGVQTLRRYIDAAERKLLDPLGLSAAAFEVLDTLSHNPGISAAELGDRLHVSRQATHVQVAGLIERGLIERRSGGRAIPLRLTRTGRAALRAARVRAARVDAVFAEALGPERLAELQQLLAIGVAAFATTSLAPAEV